MVKMTDLPLCFHGGEELFVKKLTLDNPIGEHGAEETDPDPILAEYALSRLPSRSFWRSVRTSEHKKSRRN